MKIVFTNHVHRKRELFKELGWNVSLEQIKATVERPDHKGKTKTDQDVAISNLGEIYVLRVVYEVKGDIIVVITFYPTRRGRYKDES